MLAAAFSFQGVSCLANPNQPLTPESRIAIVRALSSEFADLKVALPTNKTGLEVNSQGSFDSTKNEKDLAQAPTILAVGTRVQITQIVFEQKRIVLWINGGGQKKRKFWEHVEVGVGSTTQPVSKPTPAAKGSFVTVKFEKTVPELSPDQVKQLLSQVLDFSLKSAAKSFIESVPEEFREAVKEKRVEVGMDRDLVLTILGRPLQKVREKKGDVEYEDWIYGEKPMKVTFVTFVEGKVIGIKAY